MSAPSAPRGKIRIVPLGGLGEIGLNLLVVEAYAAGTDAVEAAVAIDCGVMFPSLETPGIDLMIPDLGYLRGLGDRLLGVLVTHGHEDHIGALPFLLREREVPIYATPFSMALIEAKLAEHHVLDKGSRTTFAPRDRWRLGPFEVEALQMTHSIVDAVGFAIRTPVGTIVHTGDFKIDHTPIDGRTCDLARLAEIGAEGMLLLLSDSTNVDRPGTTPSERAVRSGLERAFQRAAGRVIVATFASHVHRMQQVVDLSLRFGRKVALAGRSLVQNVKIARELGKLDASDDAFVALDELGDVAPSQLTLLAAGSQGEPRSALSRIATDDYPSVAAGPGDVVVLSSRVIPGNERPISSLVNHLCRRGAEVLWEGTADIHVSGHASQEELRLMLRLAQPRYFVPVHGEYRHLVKHVALAVESGLARDRCFLLEDGQTLVIGADGARAGERVEAGRVFVDGKGVGDVEEVVLRDRRHLSQDGLVLAILGVHPTSGAVVAGPDLVSRGFVLEGAHQPLLQEARAAILAALEGISPEGRGDPVAVQESVRRTLKKFFDKRLDRRPMILPFIMEM
ncbi:MAG: ribonuclease J [Candidatus Binatia bacterium]